MTGPGKPKRKAGQSKGLPTSKQVMEFITSSGEPAGKREIARHFGLKGQQKIALKALLKDMADEGLIDSSKGRAFHKMGGIPKVTVLKIVKIDGNQPIAVPENWQAEAAVPPRIRVIERGRRNALAVGDRILARTEEAGNGWTAHPMKKLSRASEMLMGVVEKGEGGKLWLAPVDKKIRYSTPIKDPGDAQPGDLVMAEKSGSRDRVTASVSEVLGDPLAPRSFSLIALNKYDIPIEFPQAVLDEAEVAAKLPIEGDYREDLRDLPIIAIDPADARDHDDAIWAQPDDSPENPGGFRAVIAIADVSFYVRPGGEIDRSARKRGNSVYFPDRVVPMLPEILSADVCSLKQGQDRAAMACHIVINAKGQVTSWRFTRAIVRLSANIAYEDAQAQYNAMDSAFAKEVLKPLWDCWKLLLKARHARDPLELDLAERRVVLDEDGNIESVAPRERLDAHRLVEDYMIAANVAAAKALEAKKAPTVYRVHEVPSREKLIALKEFLAGLDIKFALGQVIRPGTFNHIMDKVDNEEKKPLVTQQVLRSQTQAYYTPHNQGHFGLALGSYAHFTSPIRRYADLLVHRALVDAYNLEGLKPQNSDIPAKSGLGEADRDNLDGITERISGFERRAMKAEWETIDRYVAAYLAKSIGEIHTVRITGVQDFGFFVTVDDIGGDGLVPARSLGDEYFVYDAGAQTLIGEHSRESYYVGRKLDMRLVEANPISGALKFELPEGGSSGNNNGIRRDRRGRGGRPPSGKHKRGSKNKSKYRSGKRGRSANIKHKGR